MASVKVLLFGDGTADPVNTIKELDNDAKSSPSLHAFMRLTTAALRNELSSSTSPVKKQYPRFDSLLELANWYAESGTPDISVSLVLLCAAQLGALIRGCERDSTLFDMTERNPVHYIGLCNGMIAAAAAAACRSLADLVAISPALVCLNMRLTFAVVERSSAIDPSRQTWAVITPGIRPQDHEKLIADFVKQKGSLPLARRPYMSSTSESSATISGPPSTLKEYFSSSEVLVKAKKIETPLNGAFHASHLWSLDLKTILGEEPLFDSYKMKMNCSFPSIHTGEAIKPASLKAVLLQCMEEIANKTFNWGTIVQKLCRDVKKSYTHAELMAVGPDRVTSTVGKALAEAGVQASIGRLSSEQIPASLPSDDDVAIVGMSARMPGAEDLEKIWDLLREGFDAHGPVPADRTAIYDQKRYGCFLERPGFFDAKLFRLSPREARQTDPGQRLALLTTYEALEMAGYSPNARPSFASDRIGAFLGSTLDDYRDTENAQNVDIYYVSGGIRSFGPGRLNYHFKWEGPSMSVDTACSSSAVAIQLAFQSLRAGECDMAVAGGMNILTSPSMYDGLYRGGFLSKTGACKTFGSNADGYCRGEGVGTIVLKRLKDAVADHDNILAVIKGCVTNHSAFAESITRPETGAQVAAMQMALRQARVEPEDVDAIEMHGTGTQAGDGTEFKSSATVFRPGKAKRRHPVHVGAIKANIGHGEGVAAVSSLVKVVLSMKKNAIPPNIGFKSGMNPKFPASDLELLSIKDKEMPLPRLDNQPRTFMLNSFQAAGGNTAMVIADAPIAPQRPADPRKHHVVVISGHVEKSFVENQKKLAQHIQDHSELRLSDLAYTTTARRMQNSLRKAYVAQDKAQLLELMQRDAKPASKIERPVVFAFTGQGSHFLAVAQELMKSCQVFRSKLEHCERICQSQGLPQFMHLVEDPSKAGSQIGAFQVSLVSIQISLTAMWRSWGIAPQAVIGHSIGEYAALVAAGVLDESDALLLAGSRAQQIEKLAPGEYGMLSAGIPAEEFEKAVADLKLENSVLACDNAAASAVVSGPVAEVQRLAEELTARKVKTTMLDLPYGFHSPQLREIGMTLRNLGRGGIQFQKPRVPVASTLLGKVVTEEGVFGADYMASQTMDRVRFREGLLALSEHLGKPAINNAVWLEVGTHPTCGPMVVSTLGVPKDQIIYSLRRNEEHSLSISKTLGRAYELGVEVDWAAYHNEHHASLSVVDLPRYAFDLSNYWIPFTPKRVEEAVPSAAPAKAAAPAIDPTLAPFHHKIHETADRESAEARYTCDMSSEKLRTAIAGHLIEGMPLCPASVYADLAYHAAARLLGKVKPLDKSANLDVGQVSIHSPLVLTEGGANQTLLLDVSWSASNPKEVKIAFSSTIAGSGQKNHAEIIATVGTTDQCKDLWEESQYLIQSRIALLNEPGSRAVQTLHKKMIYTLFANCVVDYSDPFRIVNRMAVDYENKEGVAELIPGSVDTISTHSPGPYCLDVLMHMAGFVLNSDPSVPSNTVFICNGWSGLQLSEPLRAGQSYTCHTRFQADRRTANNFVGNVTLLLDDQVIGVCRGLVFHKMARKSLQKLLGAKTAPAPAVSSSKAPAAAASKPQQAAPAPSTSTSADPWNTVLELLSAQTSAPVSDLQDNAILADLGVDSLLSISFLGELKEKVGIELDVTTFSSCETVGALKQALQPQLKATKRPQPPQLKTQSAPAPKKSSTKKQSNSGAILCEIIASEVGVDASEISGDKTIADLGVDSLLTLSIAEQYKLRTGVELAATFFFEHPTVDSVMAALGSSNVEEVEEPAQEQVQEAAVAAPPRGSSQPNAAAILCEIIATEVGVDASEIAGEKTIADLGVDSLLTLSIAEQYKLQTGVELAPTFFFEHPTVDSVIAALGSIPGESSSSSTVTSDSEEESQQISQTPPSPISENGGPVVNSCVSARLQGPASGNGPKLFCLPDGSGSLFSYVHLPKIQEGLSLYALDSPFHKNPEEYNLGFGEVATIYKNEIRSIQPHGPYMIAGWSLGGIHAYEVARQFIEEGETVQHLFMIDSPCPGALPPLPSASLNLLETAGVFSGLSSAAPKVADHTRVHFVACTNAFQHWEAPVLTKDQISRLNRVTIIWAGHGCLEDQAPDVPLPGMSSIEKDMLKAKEWLCGKRTEFGPNGWDRLVGKEIQCMKVGGNHFSMMFPPVVPEVGAALTKALAGWKP